MLTVLLQTPPPTDGAGVLGAVATLIGGLAALVTALGLFVKVVLPLLRGSGVATDGVEVESGDAEVGLTVLRTTINDLREQAEELRRQLVAARSDRDGLQGRVDDLIDRLARTETDLRLHRAEAAELRAELGEVRTELAVLRSEARHSDT